MPSERAARPPRVGAARRSPNSGAAGGDPQRRRRGDLMLTAAVLAALVAAVLPVTAVIRPGPWLAGAVAIAVVVLGAGLLARRRRLPAVAVSLIEAGLWAVFMTFAFVSHSAILLLIPTVDTLREVPALVSSALEEIMLGAAPLDPSRALSFLVVGAMGLLAIVVDHVVLTARLPLLASVGVIAVSLIPAIAVPGEIDILAFVFLAAAILFLIRTETRSREAPAARAAERTAGVPATALGIAAIAVVVAVVATPLLPAPVIRAGGAIGTGPGIDASLQLGDDLRRPQEVEVMRMRSTAVAPPYLRATTLSRFDGEVWLPDRVRTTLIDGDIGFGDLGVEEDIRLVTSTTTVEVTNLASQWAPVPYPAVEVTGLEGQWAAAPSNRTVISQSGSTQGQAYEVRADSPRPTLEQIRASDAVIDDEEMTALPEGLPPVIAQMAGAVTAGSGSDYDAAIALQRWFRSDEFSYSLDAPVEDGFDGTGADAVARFLEVREGYCIHFASAFALMARTLGMPTRIVVGYLPGASTQDRVEGQVVYSISSSLLHAWPEVHFQGIGWVGFEPTNGLGTPTNFFPAATSPGSLGVDPREATPRPTSSASPTPTGGPSERPDIEGQALGGSGAAGVNPLPTLSVVLGILLLLSIPALVRLVRGRRLLAAARRGDAAAAWATVQDAAIDVGVAVPASESPRAFAARLVAVHGAPRTAMAVLANAIERASYAPPGFADASHGDETADAASAVRAGLLAKTQPSRRALALLAPRSLIVRPGSDYAAGGLFVRAR